MVTREKVFSIVKDVFKRHGAMALDTPAFELRETLLGKLGEDSKLIYDLADQGGERCSLRFDLTVPFARYMATNSLRSCKRYQIGKVYKRDNPSMGRFREFYQCDFDIASQYETMKGDFEVIKVMMELLDELNIGDYGVKLNHRKLLDGMLGICGVPAEKFRTICSLIDKLDKQTFEQIREEMVGSVASGGRYDDLIGMFTKYKVPAVGCGLGIERVFAIMEKNKDENQATRDTETQVLVAVLMDDLPLAVELASELWAAKLNSELWAAKLNAEFSAITRRLKHFEHAKKSRIPLMVRVGEDELKKGVVKLKYVEAAKEDEIIPRDGFVEEVKRRLGSICT